MPNPSDRALHLVTDTDTPPHARLPRRSTPVAYVIRVSLLDSVPPIWRTLRVPSDMALPDFHDVLQTAMGWEDRHLHFFTLGEGPWDPHAPSFHSKESFAEGDFGPHVQSEVGVHLDEILADEGDEVLYVYDFGDDWTHRIELTHVAEEFVDAVECLDGARACPPEDCGGAPGYDDLLSVLADPGHPEYAHLSRWAGDIDPERFDHRVITANLHRARRHRQAWAATADASPALRRILSRTRPAAVPLLADALASARIDEPVLVDPTTAAQAVEKIAWMIEHVGAGIKLTAAGYLPPATIAAMRAELDWSHWDFIGRGNREGDHPQAMALRETIVHLGLARKLKGEFVATKVAAQIGSDPIKVWNRIASRLVVGRDDPERQAGIIALVAVAAGIDEPREILTESMPAIGWYSDNPRAFAWAALPTEQVLWMLGAHPHAIRSRKVVPLWLPTLAKSALQQMP